MTPTTRTAHFSNPPAGIIAGGTGGLLSGVFRVFFTLLIVLLPVPISAATLPGTAITNIATAEFGFLRYGLQSIESNTQTLIVTPLPTPTTAVFLRYQPGSPSGIPTVVRPTQYSVSGTNAGPFVPLPAPLSHLGTVPIDLEQPLKLDLANTFLAGEPLFIQLTDLDQNLFYNRIDTITLKVTSSTGDIEFLILEETGPNTGVFSGYLQTTHSQGASGNGQLQVDDNGTVTVIYQDSNDASDVFVLEGLFDPQGFVFDSASGIPVNGVSVTLIDIATGQPAEVFGVDGVSRYPATVISGGTVTDAGGTFYQFPPGAYRFPLLRVGTYRLEVTPPSGSGYAAPSNVEKVDLQLLPGGPWNLYEDAWRGHDFVLAPVPILRVDIPVDPIPKLLWIEKKAGKELVGIGDFVPYEVKIANTSSNLPADAVVLTDRLPIGFRYQPGSVRIDNTPAPDPTIADDGRTLTWRLGSVAAGQNKTISYVTEVTAGTRIGKAINSATAVSERGVSSNEARAVVKVRDDFMREKSRVLGRVMVGDCSQDDTKLSGVAGVQLYLEDGTNVVTDKDGLYHFEGLHPGTHVVQLDPETYAKNYEIALCSPSTRFADTGSSQFVDLQAGSLWRADFYLKEIIKENSPSRLDLASNGTIQFGLQSQLHDSARVTLTLPLEIQSATANNVRLSVILPPGSEYVAGSSIIAGAAISDPDIMSVVLNYRLGDLSAGTTASLSLDVHLTEALKGDEIPFRALLTVDSDSKKNLRTTPILNTLKRIESRNHLKLPDITLRPEFSSLSSELSVADRKNLDELAEKIRDFHIVQIVVTGHTDSVPISQRNWFRIADNQALSLSRARAVADYLQQRLSIPADLLLISGVADAEPLADNTTDAGRARNRRVELRLICEKIDIQSEIIPATTEAQADPLTIELALPPAVAPQVSLPQTEASPLKTLRAKIFSAAMLDELTPGYEWLWPPVHFYPEIPSLKIAVKHDPSQRVRLTINGTTADPLNFEGTRRNASRTAALSHWNGVDIKDGDNLLRVDVLDSDGKIVASEERISHYSLSPVTAVFVPEASTLTADSAAPAIIAIKLLDREGHPAREGVIGEFRVTPPHSADKSHFANPELAEQNRLGEKTRFVVKEGGITFISLTPTNRSGEVEITLTLAEGEEKITAWLKPQLRDWILVGLGEGTTGYATLSGNMENFSATDEQESFFYDGRVAFFAKGKVLGSWLLTMAYDTAKEQKNSLKQTIDPDTYYTVYGDGSQQQYDAAGQNKLYIKIERDQFYALFGDYDTGLTVSELSRYSRSLNGFKSELQSRFLVWNIFATETSQSFVKDELPGDGTSGLFRLSRQDIVLNSEKIVIETRDRFDNNRIIASRSLNRHLDYNIDYDLGTLFFKEPIPTRDNDFNPILIVVDYEAADSGDKELTYGGRGALRFFDQRLEVGASFIHEGQNGSKGDLYGADTTVKISPEISLKAETAQSDIDAGTKSKEGKAWLAEVKHIGKILHGRAYVNEQQPSFGLGQQRESSEGLRKVGAEADVKINDKLSVQGSASREVNLQTDAKRDLTEAALVWKKKSYSLRSGLRQAIDHSGDGSTATSLQGTFGANWQATPRLALRFNHDQSLAGNDAAADYPTRTVVGADFKLNEKISLFADQEWTFGENEDSESTRAGLKATPWEGAHAMTGVEQTINEEGTRTAANMGLKQSWQLTKRFSLDAGLDRSQTLRHPGNNPVNPDTAPASGSSNDYTAVSTGANWKEEKWSWENRLEYRTSNTEDKWNILSSSIGELRQGLAIFGKTQITLIENVNGNNTTQGDIRLGVAWRAIESRWVFLNRLDYLFDRQTNTSNNSGFNNWRLINSLHANIKPNRRTQIALQYGLKYVQENIAGMSYSGYTDVVGIETRYDVSRNCDFGLHGNVLHSWQGGQLDYRTGASVGYKMMKNTWLSIGYNLTGFQDVDFSVADFTAQGPFIKFRFKFDQNSVREALKQF